MVKPTVGLGGGHEELHLHLLKLARAEDEVAGGDLVTEARADLGDAKGRLLAPELEVVPEVQKDSLRRLGPQEDSGPRFFNRPDGRLEQEVEVPRFGEVALGGLPGTLRRFATAVGLL